MKLLLWIALAAATMTALQVPPRSAKEGVYTAEQAGRGKTAYDEKCASCHGSMASVTPDMAPLLNDGGFQNLWRERSLAQLFDRIRETMPQDKPNTLSPEETAALVAYMHRAALADCGERACPPEKTLF